MISFKLLEYLMSFQVYGGVPKKDQLPALRAGAPILVATPGRLNDFLELPGLEISMGILW